MMKRFRFLGWVAVLSGPISVPAGCDSGSGEAGPPQRDPTPPKVEASKGYIPEKTTEGKVVPDQ
jgi:hypothetical protein